MKNPWFTLHKWGTGWIPITWQGWIVTIAFIGFTIYNFFRIDGMSHSVSDTLINFIPQTLVFAGLFSVVCYFKSDKSSDKNMLK